MNNKVKCAVEGCGNYCDYPVMLPSFEDAQKGSMYFKPVEFSFCRQHGIPLIEMCIAAGKRPIIDLSVFNNSIRDLLTNHLMRKSITKDEILELIYKYEDVVIEKVDGQNYTLYDIRSTGKTHSGIVILGFTDNSNTIGIAFNDSRRRHINISCGRRLDNIDIRLVNVFPYDGDTFKK